MYRSCLCVYINLNVYIGCILHCRVSAVTNSLDTFLPAHSSHFMSQNYCFLLVGQKTKIEFQVRFASAPGGLWDREYWFVYYLSETQSPSPLWPWLTGGLWANELCDLCSPGFNFLYDVRLLKVSILRYFFDTVCLWYNTIFIYSYITEHGSHSKRCSWPLGADLSHLLISGLRLWKLRVWSD